MTGALEAYRANLSEEDKQLMANKAKETRDNKRKWAEENLTQDFGEDETLWRELASEAGIRMPMKHIPATDTKHIKRALKHLNIDAKDWLEEEGLKTLKSFGVINPQWPAYAHVGLLLEYCKESKDV